MFRRPPRGRSPHDDDLLLLEDDIEEDDFFDEELDEEPAPSRRRGGLFGALLGLLLGVVLSLGAIFTAASVSRVGGFGGSSFNVLVMGTDQRPDERGADPGRTDSMMLVSLGPSGVSMLSIPRDLWVAVPGHGEGRINTAYRAGELEGPGRGASLAERTVESALGVHVDRFLLIDMAGVRDMVDQLGGIDVDNPTVLVDDEFPTDDYGIMTIMIPAGRQHLNGELALAYARTRHPDSDFGRMGRQQQVIAAILSKMRGPAGLLRAPLLVGTIQKATRTDLTSADYVSLGPAAFDLSGDRMRRLVIGPDLVTPVTGSDGAELLQTSPRLRTAVAAFLGAPS